MKQQLPFCPVETTLTLIGDKWKVLILRDLMEGTKRFGEIKKTIGKVTQKVLTANLREMETMGLLTREVYAQVPPKVEYTLTETGYSLKPVLDAMSIWGIEYKKKNGCSLNTELLGENEDIGYVHSRLVFVDDLSSAINLMNTFKYETNCTKLIIDKNKFDNDFFKLSTKLIYDILNQYVKYNFSIAIIGDFSENLQSFQNFINECNNGDTLYFCENIEDAINKLS